MTKPIGFPSRMLPRRTFEERFWDKVAQRDPGQCWLWGAALDRDGYGRIGSGKRSLAAHRASWEMHNGAIPDGLGVLHKCDNPRCVNPNHLFLGAQAENLADMRAKGRAKRPPANRLPGSRNGSSKLTDEAVAEIRTLAGKVPQRNVAAQYGISPAQVCRIQTGTRRGHATA